MGFAKLAVSPSHCQGLSFPGADSGSFHRLPLDRGGSPRNCRPRRWDFTFWMRVPSGSQASQSWLALTDCSTASILGVYINSLSTPVYESILLQFTFLLCQHSSCLQKAEANDEWIPTHVKHSRCWEQDDSPHPTSALPLPGKAFLPQPISASSSPYPSLLKHFYWTVQHRIITSKLLLSFLSRWPLPQLCLIFAFQAFPIFCHCPVTISPILIHSSPIITGVKLSQDAWRNHVHVWIIRLSLDILI